MPSSFHSRSLPPGPLSIGIAEELRTAILNGDLAPGSRLVETELASTFQVSRGPLREALRTLERDGLIKYLPRRGNYVASLSSRDWQEVYSLRFVLERFNYGLIARDIHDGDIHFLQELVREMDMAGATDNIAAQVGIDMRFHDYLIDRGGHRHLAEVWHNLGHLVGAIFVFAMRSGGITARDVPHRHQAILNAFASRDVERVTTVLAEHYFIDLAGGPYALPSVPLQTEDLDPDRDG